jgi:hypothetical protein
MISTSKTHHRLNAAMALLFAGAMLYGCATAPAPALSEPDRAALADVQDYLDGPHVHRAFGDGQARAALYHHVRRD